MGLGWCCFDVRCIDRCHGVFASLLLLFLISLTVCHSETALQLKQEYDEYCEWETFNATCDSDEIVMIRNAKYGRMRTGRCISNTYGDTCSTDVTSELDKECSGNTKCEVRVISLHMKGCGSKDFKFFLEASYECQQVENAFVCKNDSQSILPKTDSGLLASFFAQPSSSPESASILSCPVYIRVKPHQRINLTLIDFSIATNNGKKPLQRPEEPCKHYATATDLHQNGTSSDFQICGGKERESFVYLSKNNAVAIRFNLTTAKKINFLLKYEAFGCPPLSPPPNAWISRSTPLTTSIHCNRTEEAWHLTCRGVHWVGQVGNCSTGLAPEGNDDWSLDDIFANSSHYPLGVLIVVCLGVAIGVAVGVLLLVIVMAYMRRRRRRRIRGRMPSCIDNKAKYSSQSCSSLARQQLTPLSVSRTFDKINWNQNRPLPDPLATRNGYIRSGASVGSISTPITPFDCTLLSPCRQIVPIDCGSTSAVFSTFRPSRTRDPGTCVGVGTRDDGGLISWQSDSCIADPVKLNNSSPYYFKLDPRMTTRPEEVHSPIQNCAMCQASATLNRRPLPFIQ